QSRPAATAQAAAAPARARSTRGSDQARGGDDRSALGLHQGPADQAARGPGQGQERVRQADRDERARPTARDSAGPAVAAPVASAGLELDELDDLIAMAGRARLTRQACERCVALLAAAPGRTRDVAEALAAQRSAPAVDALLRLPAGTPGRLEGVFQAVRH